MKKTVHQADAITAIGMFVIIIGLFVVFYAAPAANTIEALNVQTGMQEQSAAQDRAWIAGYPQRARVVIAEERRLTPRDVAQPMGIVHARFLDLLDSLVRGDALGLRGVTCDSSARAVESFDALGCKVRLVGRYAAILDTIRSLSASPTALVRIDNVAIQRDGRDDTSTDPALDATVGVTLLRLAALVRATPAPPRTVRRSTSTGATP